MPGRNDVTNCRSAVITGTIITCPTNKNIVPVFSTLMDRNPIKQIIISGNPKRNKSVILCNVSKMFIPTD